MKCDELKPVHVPAEMCGGRTLAEAFDYYERKPVDEAFDELKQKLHDAEMARDDAEAANTEYRDDIRKLKAENERLNRELEHVKNGDCINTCDVLEKHVKDELKAKRALWIARAKRAIEKIAWFRLWNASISTMNPEDGARQEYDKWKKALGNFLAKTEEYK